MLIEVRGIGDYRILGQTRDDAAGEAFDKTAKLLGLPYPGGPELAQIAIRGRPGVYVFPRPMIDRPGFEFSFSGLKTAVMQAVRAAPLDEQGRADVAHAVQEAIVSTLCTRALQALKFTGHRALVVAGGVGANRELRTRLAREAEARGARVYYPRTEFCTDNAAMIAVAGLHRLRAGERAGNAIAVRARWPLSELAPPGRAAVGAASHLT
jgi:N6-L-threonylcarbamoyladenine synthase